MTKSNRSPKILLTEEERWQLAEKLAAKRSWPEGFGESLRSLFEKVSKVSTEPPQVKNPPDNTILRAWAAAGDLLNEEPDHRKTYNCTFSCALLFPYPDRGVRERACSAGFLEKLSEKGVEERLAEFRVAKMGLLAQFSRVRNHRLTARASLSYCSNSHLVFVRIAH